MRRTWSAMMLVVTVGCGQRSTEVGSVTRAVDALPDLVVSGFEAPLNLLGGATFSVEATVCNASATAAGASAVQLAFSQDAVLGSGDVAGPASPVPALAPWRCASVQVAVTAPVSAVTEWFLLGVADGAGAVDELDEANNVLVRGPLGVGTGFDLMVAAVRPRDPDWREPVDVDVCNRGNQAAPQSSLSIFQSADEVVTPYPPDFALAWQQLPDLGPGECKRVEVTQPLEPWTEAYLGFFISSAPELVSSNDLYVTGPVPGLGLHDVMVKDVVVPSNVSGPFALNVRVCNRGGITSSWSELQVYASADRVLRLPPAADADTLLAVDATSGFGFSPGACGSSTIQVSGLPAGAWHLIVVLDTNDPFNEAASSNNVWVSSLIGSGVGPDLVVTDLQAPTSGNQVFSVDVSACNRGNAPSTPSSMAIMARSEVLDSALPESGLGEVVGGTALPGLEPSQCVRRSVQVSAPGSGRYRLGAMVDLDESLSELVEDNNISWSAWIGLGNGPDLVPTLVQARQSAGGSLMVRVAACNAGTAASAASTVAIYSTRDGVIESSVLPGPYADLQLASATLAPLMAGECRLMEVPVSGAPTGVFNIGAVLDPTGLVTELIEANNALVGTGVGVGTGSDLELVKLTDKAISSLVTEVGATVCNRGPRASVGSHVDVGFIDEPDYELMPGPASLAQIQVPSLQVGQCRHVTTQLGIYPLGRYLVATVVGLDDPVATNDAAVGGLVGQYYFGELAVVGLEYPPDVDGAFEVEVRVCNGGFQQDAGTVEIYGVRNGIGPRQLLATSQNIVVSADACVSEVIPVGALVPGDWVLTAEGVWSGGLPGNDTFAGEHVAVGVGPDLVVTEVVAPPSAVGTIPIAVRVCNAGTGAAAASDVAVVLADVDGPVPSSPYGDGVVHLMSVSVPSLAEGECQHVSGSAAAPAFGPMRVGAIVDPNRTVLELREDNNGFVGAVIGLGAGPDLAVASLDLPPSADGAFVATAEVCNRGTTALWAGGGTVELYADPDPNVATIVGQASMIGFGTTPALAAGSCGPVDLHSTSGGTGTYHIAVRADGFHFLSELDEENNLLLAGPMGFGQGPDLIPVSIDVPSVLSTSAHYPSVARTCNQGTTASAGGSFEVVASSQHMWGNPVLAGGPLPALDPGECADQPITLWFLAEGTFSVALNLEPYPMAGELVMSNNVLEAGTVLVADDVCGNSTVELNEACDDGNLESGDGCDSQCRIEQKPWQQLASGTWYGNYAWDYAMGYHFTTLTKGVITALGGSFSGTKIVRLFDRSSGALLAESEVVGTTGDAWSYAQIDPVPVDGGRQFTVAVYLAGVGGSQRRSVGSYPKVAQDIQIDGTCYVSTSANPAARPTNIIRSSYMYGQADIVFSRSVP